MATPSLRHDFYANVWRRYPATSLTKRCTDASAIRWPAIAFMVLPTAPNGGS